MSNIADWTKRDYTDGQPYNWRVVHLETDVTCLPKGCRYFESYLFDPGLQVHLCEVTPSFELNQCGAFILPPPDFPEDENWYDSLDDETREIVDELENPGWGVDYTHCSTVERMFTEDTGLQVERDEEGNTNIDEAQDYRAGSTPYVNWSEVEKNLRSKEAAQ